MIVRRAALIVALLLLAYVAFSVVWMLTEPLRVVPPTPTRTPKPTYTPVATREVLLIVTPTPTPSPSPTVAPTATPTASREPTPTPSVTPTPQPRRHVVQAGDTLLGIAQQYGVDYWALLGANDITDADVLYVGQVLTIPVGASPLAPGARTHTVRAGETLSGIAVRYGVTYETLLEVNAISDPDRIYVGQVLVIPEE